MFHLIMVYISVLNKRFGGAGIRDALVQSLIIAEGSADSTLKGKSYNRGIRLYKIFYEALNRLIIVELDRGTNLQEYFEATANFSSFCRERYSQFKDCDEFCRLLDIYINLRQTWIIFPHGLINFWLSCVEMIELLFNIIYAVRSWSWDLLLEFAREMIPYCFACNNANYARYLTNFLDDMLAFESDFPEVYQRFSDADFAARLTNTNRFSRSKTGKVIQMAINKDTKTPGGTTRISAKIGAVKRWGIIAPYRANMRKCLHLRLCYNKQRYSHSDLNSSSIRRDKNDVQVAVDIFTNVFILPFSEMPLASISTGLIVNENTAESILEAKINGMNEMGKFISDILQPGKTV